MSFEVELKFRTLDHAEIAARLAAMAAEAGPSIAQEDTYLCHPSRDFARSGEALRVRRVGDRSAVTYKGPRREGPTKTRPEIEVPFAEGAEARADLLRLFEALGFRPVAQVCKVRTPYHLTERGHRLEVALDAVDGLGSFVEVETIAEGDAALPEAQRVVLDVAAALGLTEVERRSYLRMTLEQRDRTA